MVTKMIDVVPVDAADALEVSPFKTGAGAKMSSSPIHIDWAVGVAVAKLHMNID